jgi:hypothetical protein
MANQLIKTGITTGQTIQPFHVTQSVDAFTGLTAYDITISGSLTLTGSVSSLNGFTGNLTGTASRATEAGISTLIRPSNTVSNFGYTIPYLSGTGSTATLFYSATGPRYNPSTDTLTTANLVGTASRATEAVTATNLNGTAYLSGSAVGAASVFKFIAGAGQTDASSTAAITVNELAIGGMRVLNQTCFITATAESATGTSIITVDPAGVPPNLQFKSSAPNTKFHYQIMYI